jgi:hypothetical protein
MFQNCPALQKAPAIKATTLGQRSCNSMFNGCTNLNWIEVRWTTAWSNNYTSAWVTGVAATGTFRCPSGLPDTYGTGAIPTGWTRTNI